MHHGVLVFTSSLLTLLLAQGEHHLSGVVMNNATMRCEGLVDCVERNATSRGLQGFRSPSLFSDVLRGVMERWLRIGREGIKNDEEPSVLLRNGLKRDERQRLLSGSVVDVLWQEAEETGQPVLSSLDAALCSEEQSLSVLSREEVVAFILDKESSLDNAVFASMKRPPLLSLSNPQHALITTVFRSLLLLLSYHSNTYSVLTTLPSPQLQTLYKKTALLLNLLNAQRQQRKQTWDAVVLFASSLVQCVYSVLPAALSVEECYEVVVSAWVEV